LKNCIKALKDVKKPPNNIYSGLVLKFQAEQAQGSVSEKFCPHYTHVLIRGLLWFRNLFRPSTHGYGAIFARIQCTINYCHKTSSLL